ncbi:MAG TPA: YbaN family protein [Candidatus Merdivicinus excrementipullorum]|uniref:YbaN family protein n=1 Tax=Candidatus Merdivicinus excrementipullorum TaxID=2840867 RepID=A0A9D1K131_9FIRM|nr:YbaN family protein [Candidatus Merdivicinus excrementipullorum]
MKLKRLIFLTAGFICLGMGCVGVVLPILPTVPFFLATVFCFANSSRKLHDWFISTKLYKKHLESFVKKKGMTVQTKLGIIIPVTIVMGIGFWMMMRGGVLAPSIILLVVWVCHIVYFIFGVKTLKQPEMNPDQCD